MSLDLNPCPFCNQTNLSMNLSRYEARIVCNVCDAQGPKGREPDEFLPEPPAFERAEKTLRYTPQIPQMSAPQKAVFLWNKTYKKPPGAESDE